MIAGAGSGKTTYLIAEALRKKDESVLITTFTDANENSIRETIIAKNGCIPPNITVQTWFSFLLQNGVKPYQSFLYDGIITGLDLVNQKSGIKYYSRKRPVYFSENEIGHYISKTNQIYSDKVSKFVVKADEKSEGLILDRIKRIYPNIYIDEVQDLAGYDLEILRMLEEIGCKLLLVGDPRQVTFHTHEEAKNKKYSGGKIADYVREHCKSLVVDDTTLNYSYRNPQSICALANQLYPEMKPCESKLKSLKAIHSGVFLVKPEDVDCYLKKYKPVQLRDSVRTVVNKDYEVMNFGNAKGLTMKHVLIYPTKPITEWLRDRSKSLEEKSRAKLYVAITRAQYSVAFVVDSKTRCSISDIQIWTNTDDEQV